MEKIISNEEFDELFNKASSVEDFKLLEKYSLKTWEIMKSEDFLKDIESFKNVKELDKKIRENYPAHCNEKEFEIKFPTYRIEVTECEDRGKLSVYAIENLLSEFKGKIYVHDSEQIATSELSMGQVENSLRVFLRILFCTGSLDENIDIKEKTKKILDEHGYSYNEKPKCRWASIPNNLGSI